VNPGAVRTAWEISPTQVFDPRTVQPTASRYTDYAISSALPVNNNCHISEVKQAKPGNFQARRVARSYDGEHWAEKCLNTVLLS
jgi:hypothetical protein